MNDAVDIKRADLIVAFELWRERMDLVTAIAYNDINFGAKSADHLLELLAEIKSNKK